MHTHTKLNANEIARKSLEILKTHDLRKTPCRLAILRLFMEKDFALSHQNIDNLMDTSFDRVTIYRTLGTFEECGILHKVPNDMQQTKYALCSSHCSHHHHQDKHVHFKCIECGNIYCFENYVIPTFDVPKGYTVVELNFLVHGICAKCAK